MAISEEILDDVDKRLNGGGGKPTPPTILQYPLQRQGDYGATIEFTIMKTDHEGQVSVDNGSLRSAGDGENTGRPLKLIKREVPESKISLYLPAGLAFNDGVAYDNVNIGIPGLAAERNMGEGEGFMDAMTGIKDALSQLSGTKAFSKLSVLASMNKLTPDGVAAGVTGALRVKANPHTRVLFGSVPVRTFEFSFNFLPASYKEAETVHNIIKNFRIQLYPEGIAEAAESFLGYNFPDPYRIQFMYNDEEIRNAPKLLDCYLLGVQTNYNPNEMAFFKLAKRENNETNAGEIETGKDVKFSEISLNLSFTEERTLFRQDIERQYRGEHV